MWRIRRRVESGALPMALTDNRFWATLIAADRSCSYLSNSG
jgi:hypothetical protein